MAVCPACQHELDDKARTAGRCPACGTALRPIAQRTIADIRTAKPTDADDLDQGGATMELPAGGLGGSIDIQLKTTLADVGSPPAADSGESLSSSKTLNDPPPVKIPLGPRPGGPKQATVTFGNERTIEFAGGDSAIDESMLTSQWEGNIPKAGGAGATIKQKETISGTYVSSSSLIVKSRHVTRTGAVPAGRPTSPADAPDYELLNVIGEGGMGVVYAARQSSIARTVALKMLKTEDADLAQRDKFISEAVVTGELDHPNIVPIYDLGSNNDGALFYSMKRVKGTPWHKVIRDKTLDENLHILLRVADAVAFAHVNGVIHRDLKPENVMLGDFGEVLVMDWGLARVTNEFPNAASVTQSDAMGGTPAYMAPEMATGPLERITPASDVYLLGAILYEIVTGKPPHTGKTVMACLFAAAKNQIAPSEKSGELVDIAIKAMSTKAEARHASVQDFQAAVREYQAHADSLRLLDVAKKHVHEGADKQDYELYARAIYALEEALTLWPGNNKAESLLHGARLDYARLALNKGDYDLGASLLNPAEVDHQPILADIEAGRRERESRQRKIKLLKGAVAAMIAAVTAVVFYAYRAVSVERDEAVRQRGIAVEARGEAEKQRDLANTARTRAEAAEDEAQKNFEAEQVARADEMKQREIAQQREREAVEQRKIADEARVAATKAAEAEAYSAYISRIGLTKVKLEENAFDVASDLLDECPEGLRNWEWGRLRYLTQLAYQSWTAPAPLAAIAYAPDGAHFATGGWDGKAAIWNLNSGERTIELPLGQYVHSVAYDAAGDRFAAASSNGKVNVYRSSNGELLASLAGHQGAVHSVRFSPDGRRLLTCGVDQTARLWDLSTGLELQVLHGHSWWVWAAEFSPDGRRIVTTGQEGQVVVWEQQAPTTNTGVASAEFVPYKQIKTFSEHVGPVYAARFSPETGEIATAGNDGRVLLWDADKIPKVELEEIVKDLRFLSGDVVAPERTPPPFRTLAGHGGPVRALSFSPDGKTLASAGEDNVVMVWDVAAGVARHQLRGHASHVMGCAFSPDGQMLLSAGRDSHVKLWQPSSYGETRLLASGDADAVGVLSARFSANGSQVVSASRDRSASLWDVSTLARRQQFQEGHDFLASSAAFFTDGSRVATAAVDGTVRIWDIAKSAELFSLPGTGYAAAVAASDDGRFVATPSVGSDVLVWDAETGKLTATLTGHKVTVSALRFAPGGQVLATGDENGVCRLWRKDSQTGTWTSAGDRQVHSRTITALAFVGDGARLIAASRDNTCSQWDVATFSELEDLVLKHPDAIADMAVTPDGRFAITACDDGQLRMWSIADAQVLHTLSTVAQDTKITSIDVSPDGRLVAAANANAGTIRVWDLATEQEFATGAVGKGNVAAPANGDVAADHPPAWLDFGPNSNRVWGVRFAPDSARLLSIGGNDAELRDIATGHLIGRYSPHGVVASADISPDGTRIVTGSWDRTAKIWDAASGRVIAKLPELHTDFVNSVCFSPDGARILTASNDGTARLWDAASGQPQELVLRGHKGAIRQACFSPDGARILTAGEDHTARVWDAQSGAELHVLDEHLWPVLCAAFSADGRRVITGSVDNTAIVWDPNTGAEITRLAGHTAGVTAVALSPDGSRALTGSQDNSAKLWDATTSKEIMTLAGHTSEVTSAAFSPDGRTALTSGRDSRILLWPTIDWTAPLARQARLD